jgi:uncharacterized protein YuzE
MREREWQIALGNLRAAESQFGSDHYFVLGIKGGLNMQITLDNSEGLLYIQVREGKINKTVELDAENEIFVDLDKYNKVLGFEFINPVNVSGKELNNFAKKFNVPLLNILSPQGMKKLSKRKELVPA